MVRRIAVSYSGGLDTSLDKSIQSAIESIGGKWYGQGMDMETKDRDIVFDLTMPPQIKEAANSAPKKACPSPASGQPNGDTPKSRQATGRKTSH